MSASVRLSLRTARELLGLLEVSGDSRPTFEQRELEAAISRSTRASATRRKLNAPKRATRATKREETKAIRAALVDRAGGDCESCHQPFVISSEMDHQPGRGKAAQSVENCWLLCHWCHFSKTRNEPSAAYWLKKFIEHCLKHSYFAEAQRAEARLAFVAARGGGQ